MSLSVPLTNVELNGDVVVVVVVVGCRGEVWSDLGPRSAVMVVSNSDAAATGLLYTWCVYVHVVVCMYMCTYVCVTCE